MSSWGPGVKRAVERFNEMRSPEAVAEIILLEGDNLIIRISGPFCASCGLFDYFEDLAFLLEEELGVMVSVEEVEELEDSSYLALYRLNVKEKKDRRLEPVFNP